MLIKPTAQQSPEHIYVLINQYGAKRLLLDDNINPQLVQILQIQRGTAYIQIWSERGVPPSLMQSEKTLRMDNTAETSDYIGIL